jgi:hypothetical protein
MTARDKRWEDGAQRWVKPPVLFDPRGYTVDVIARDRSRAYIEREHYSRSFPAERLSIGLFNAALELVGVAVFSEPMHPAVLPKWTGNGSDSAAELGRFVCSPSVQFNGESWFLSRAFEIAREERGFHAILSFADPFGLTDISGRITKPQHWGTIYQASNALFAGRGSPRSQVVAPNGREISLRSISKVRNGERGWRYALDQLIRAGAPAYREGESVRQWLERTLRMFRRVRHTGNLAYVFGLTRGAKRQLAALHRGGLKYPRSAA